MNYSLVIFVSGETAMYKNWRLLSQFMSAALLILLNVVMQPHKEAMYFLLKFENTAAKMFDQLFFINFTAKEN